MTARALAIALAFAAAPAIMVRAAQAPPATATPAAAQTGPQPPASPPVLSTTPTPPPGAPAIPSQMSGMPLQVGDLPPGVVVVRVVRESFANNLSNQEVELHLADGKVRKAATGQDGRARFDGVNVGDTVHTRAVVGAEPLESQRFVIPSQGGVRLVLVAGVGAGAPPSDVATMAPGAAGSAPAATAAPAALASGAPGTDGGSRLVIPLVIAFAGVGGVVIWLALRPRGRVAAAPRPDLSETAPDFPRAPSRARESTPAATPGPAAVSRTDLLQRREALFARLIQVEQNRTAATYAAAREALMEQLVEIEAELDESADPSRV